MINLVKDTIDNQDITELIDGQEVIEEYDVRL